jgi:hypothetical protein
MSPVYINTRQTKSYNPAERIIFDGDTEDNGTVYCGLVAYDEDAAKDRAKRPQWIDKITEEVAKKGIAAASTDNLEATAILGGVLAGYSLLGWGLARDIDDEFGRMELTIGPQPDPGENIAVLINSNTFLQISTMYSPVVMTVYHHYIRRYKGESYG